MPTIEERRLTGAAGTVESDWGVRRGARGGDELSSGMDGNRSARGGAGSSSAMDGNRSTLGAQSIA